MIENKPLPPLEVLKEHLDYNPDTGIIIWKKITSNRVKVGREAGGCKPSLWCPTPRVEKSIGFKGGRYLLSRIIYFMYYGEDPAELTIDHIDGNPLNNKISNLRLATRGQNSFNKKLQINNKSGVSGVYFRNDVNKWTAVIQVRGKKTTLGCYQTKKEAIQARREAEPKHFGEFRRSDYKIELKRID
jgi:hypothetical protein